ncbi:MULTISPECIES: PAAR domain-containing protein [Rhodopseudomonas]|uniref:PAAR domain-containing protein n=1 Tax=Rhodopseudomonas TaxID=1073 RepID=UPI000B0807C0
MSCRAKPPARSASLLASVLAVSLCSIAPALAQSGSADTLIGGQPAARQGDTTAAGSALVGGSPNVFINGRPAAVQGDRSGCGGVVIGGSSNVFINGKPAARAGDSGSACPGK